MHFTRKTISESSGLIIKEQWQIRKERLLASPALIIGFTGFMLILLAAVLIPLFSSVDPNAMTVAERLKAPGGKYLLGTDEFGRDIFIRLMYGARVSLWVGAVWLCFPACWEQLLEYMQVILKYWIRF